MYENYPTPSAMQGIGAMDAGMGLPKAAEIERIHKLTVRDNIEQQIARAKAAEIERIHKLTVRDNIEQQIARAKQEVERLEGIRDRLAPELLDQRIVDLQQAMRF